MDKLIDFLPFFIYFFIIHFSSQEYNRHYAFSSRRVLGARRTIFSFPGDTKGKANINLTIYVNLFGIGIVLASAMLFVMSWTLGLIYLSSIFIISILVSVVKGILGRFEQDDFLHVMGSLRGYLILLDILIVTYYLMKYL